MENRPRKLHDLFTLVLYIRPDSIYIETSKHAQACIFNESGKRKWMKYHQAFEIPI